MHSEGATEGRAPEPGEPSGDNATEVRDAVIAVRAGNPEAFERVVRLCESRLMSFAMSLMKDYEAARELTQDAFVRAYRYLDRYDDRRPFYPWLATIAFRLAQDRWRRLRRDQELARRYGAEQEDTVHEDPLDELIVDQRDRRLWRAVQALPAGERSAVLLFYRQDMTIREAARALGVTQGTVKTFLFRARRKLREALHNGPTDAAEETA